MSNDCIESILSKLTMNAALTLKRSRGDDDQLGRIYTGTGKWTTIAAMGVFSNLRKNGLAEERGQYGVYHLTPLGHEIGAYLEDHWPAVASKLLQRPSKPISS